jgi:mono/diheme cytochrome c family protein
MLQRMLIDKMENRILVGITAFVGVMILVGWVAINENGRMRSFERQFQARSIERGAELFAANCSTCHGTQGYGIAGRAPGLNSPHYFGYDYFDEIDSAINTLESEEATLTAEQDALREELVSPEINDERRAEIVERNNEITQRISGEGGIRDQLAALEEDKLAIATQLQGAIDVGYPLEITADGQVAYLDTNVDGAPDGPGRLDQVDWGSTLYDFTFTTLVHGRPTSISYWEGNQMVAWAQSGGGPLRNDQIDDLTNYILNWDKGDDWEIQDALLVEQYALVPGMGGGGGGEMADPAGDDVDVIIQTIIDEGITGDVTRGEAIYNNVQQSELNSRLGCAGCHGVAAGPATEETWASIPDRLASDPMFSDYSPEQYIIESIVRPADYIVDGWGANMPNNFGQRMSVQDIADVMVYLRSYEDGDYSDSFLQTGDVGGGNDAAEAETEEAEEMEAEEETEGGE